jgi:hypothetical protein
MYVLVAIEGFRSKEIAHHGCPYQLQQAHLRSQQIAALTAKHFSTESLFAD